jgi:predicted Zn-dependent protease
MTDFFKKTVSLLKEMEKSIKDFSGWELIEIETNSLQKLYQGDKKNTLIPHQEREVDEISYSLTAYTDLDEKLTGTGSSVLLPYLDINDQIRKVIVLSKNSKNKKWKLLEKPEKEYPEVITFDKAIKESRETIIPDIEREALSAIGNLKGININSAEVYINFSKITRETGTGIKTYKEKSGIYFEIAMEKAGSFNNKEVHEKVESVSRRDLKLTDFINECADQVNSLGNTAEPETSENTVIVISEDYISDFLFALLSQLSSAREYHKLPFLKENDKIYNGDKNQKSDSLTITLDPFISEMTLSTPYTQEGIIAEKCCVIKNDTVLKRKISNRYGQYLEMAPNGICGNIIVAPGKTSYKDFLKIEKQYLEIIKFSSLLVDDSKLTWSSEIKLAVLKKKDGSSILIKGGVVSGKISENLRNFIFSRETAKVNSPGSSYDPPKGYIGPKKMLIRSGVSIVGK